MDYVECSNCIYLRIEDDDEEEKWLCELDDSEVYEGSGCERGSPNEMEDDIEEDLIV